MKKALVIWLICAVICIIVYILLYIKFPYKDIDYRELCENRGGTYIENIRYGNRDYCVYEREEN